MRVAWIHKEFLKDMHVICELDNMAKYMAEYMAKNVLPVAKEFI